MTIIQPYAGKVFDIIAETGYIKYYRSVITMNQLTEKLSSILRLGLPKDYTSVSYAFLKDGQLIASDSLGHQGGKEKKPATTDCTYNVASVSKIFCTVAVMQQVEQGKIDLDTPVCHYLPRFTMLDERYRDITVRHCLSHTSGLPGTQWKGFSVSDVRGSHYYDEVYAHLAKSHLKAAPGEYAVYCNDGFTLAEMVVNAVTGVPFAEYCRDNITEPIGAHSTRLSPVLNPDYPLVREGKRPAELLLIQGGAGFTTSMQDLCKFGQLFLTDNKIISEKSKAEMATKHGRTFLDCDDASPNYGLGWDNVNYKNPEYDLGDGVLQKGGNSFQFTTQFFVVPKYNAVLALSETHDCKLDVPETVMRLFAVAMQELGTNIYTRLKPVPEDMIKKYSGTYLVPSGVLNLHLYGAYGAITRDDTRGGHTSWYKQPLYYNGEVFEAENNQEVFFTEHGDDIYIMTKMRGRRSPMAQKARPHAPVSQKWKDRMSKMYVLVNADPHDLVVNSLMTGFFIRELPGVEGVLIASFSGVGDSGVYGLFEASFAPLSDDIGTGFLNTPSNPSRDLVSPVFEVRNGVEYCYAASMLFRDTATLDEYNGQSFGPAGAENGVYRITKRLEKLPEIPADRRIMVLDKDMVRVYDSLMEDEYKPVEEGFILLI